MNNNNRSQRPRLFQTLPEKTLLQADAGRPVAWREASKRVLHFGDRGHRVLNLLLTQLQKSLSHIALPVRVYFCPVTRFFFFFFSVSTSFCFPFMGLSLKGPAVFHKGYLKLRRAAANERAPELKLVFTKAPVFGAALRWQAAGLVRI